MNKQLLFSIIALVALLFASCGDSGFTLNPKQIHVQVLEGDDFIIHVEGNGKEFNLTEQSPSNGFNVKKGQSVSVDCVQGDSVLVFIAGDVRGNYENGIYMSAGDRQTVSIDG